MRRAILFLAAFPLVAAGQNPATSVGRAAPRAELVSYSTLAGATSMKRAGAEHVIALEDKFASSPAGLTASFEIPWTWLDRSFFLHLRDAGGEVRLYLDEVQVGYSADRHTPVEFDVTPYIDEGAHTLRIENDGTLPSEAYLYSQPRTRVEDYRVVCSDGWIDLEVYLTNGYNYEERLSVGYDMWDPAGKKVYYNRREAILPGAGRDTVRFNEYIPGTGKYLWTPSKPELFKVVITLWSGTRAIEHIPLMVGFTARETYAANLRTIREAGEIPVYNVPPASGKTGAAAAMAELTALKKKGTNMVRTASPQPAYFYELCDILGVMVIDQADINLPEGRENRAVGGTPSNDPRMLEAYLERQRYMVSRSRNHTCVVGFSPGTMSGNGYNMYRAYRLLRELDPTRPVLYDDAQGEWNTDVE